MRGGRRNGSGPGLAGLALAGCLLGLLAGTVRPPGRRGRCRSSRRSRSPGSRSRTPSGRRDKQTNRQVSIPDNLEMLEQAGNIATSSLAAQGARAGFKGSGLHGFGRLQGPRSRLLSLATGPDPVLERKSMA